MNVIFTIIAVLFLNAFLIKVFRQRFNILSESYLWLLFSVHVLLSAVYIFYASATTSDSYQYFRIASTTAKWFSLWDTSTQFIYFLGWPFAYLFGLSYLSCMVVFSYLGFLGITFFYITARENIKLPPFWLNLTLIELIFLLPNLHFWSSSYGKGSVIVFGLGALALGLSRVNRRYITMILGGLVVFMVRPHILLTVVVSVMLALLLTGKGIKNYVRWLIFIVCALVFYYISDEVVEVTDVEGFNVFGSESLQHRAAELGKASSGFDINEYGFFFRMFTFWFRPLFFDGQGLMGLFVSFENFLYLFLFYVVIKSGIVNWKNYNGYFRICLFVFLFGSIALAQVTGNLGIAIRQKAQLMPFFFILYLKAIEIRSTLFTQDAIKRIA